MREFAEAFKAAGGTWIDNAIAGSEAARATVVNRIVGGNPRPRRSSTSPSSSTT